MRCTACGQENPEGFRFCGNCGAALGAAPQREVRKVVTIVFCDLTGSTALGDRTDPEALRGVLRSYYEGMRAILERHGGTVEKFIGDAVMAVFGVPVAHEDDAVRAVRAAWEMRPAIAALGLEARIGVNTGEVMSAEGDTLVTGDAVNVAARLEQAAAPGEILIGAATHVLVRDAVRAAPVDITAKGKERSIPALRLLDLDPEASPRRRQLDSLLIGRDAELAQLRQAFGRSVREGRVHLFTVLGAAGVGKSRLTTEFVSDLDATVLWGRCLAYGDGITYWPVISVLKQLGEPGEEALRPIVEGGRTAHELFWSIRAGLEEAAGRRPLVVVFDDVQWGEETFLDLIDHIADLSRGFPIVLLCLARPELLDKRPGWGVGKLNATTILLEPMSADETAALVDAHGVVDDATRARIVALAGGNPLFAEEMVALVREDGDVGLPASVQALLQARLDQLARTERAVVDRGAVEGEIFHRGAVAAMAEPAEIEPDLQSLVRKDMIHPATAMLAGDRAFRFRHLLIRDAAYDSLPKELRADLHERFAAWLDEHGADLTELDEVLGYHLEEAARYRRELGRPDPELERRAGRRLAAAGSRAVLRSDAPGAANLLDRALALLPADDDRRSTAVLNSIGILSELGDQERQRVLIDELEHSGDPLVAMRGRVARMDLLASSDPSGAIVEAEAVAAEATALFEQVGDDLGAAHAYALTALTAWVRSRAVPTVAALERVRTHAERAGDRLLAGRACMQQIGPLMYGPFDAATTQSQLDQLRTNRYPLAQVTVLYVEAELARRDMRFDEASGLLARAAVIERELGLAIAETINAQNRAQLLRDTGRLGEAAELYRSAAARLEELGQTSFRSTTLVTLGEVLYAAGDAESAARLAVEGEELGAAEDVVNFAYGRALRACIAADDGAIDEAEALARQAVEHAYTTDFPDVQATAHRALAYVLTRAGRDDDAADELEAALTLWRRYGYTVEEARTEALLAGARP
jgi:class 3 adenylate cyclase/tetratricopeptide (TPR) repeat protein